MSWASECGIKKAFGSFSDAMGTYRRVKRKKGWKHHGKGGKIHAYPCPHCRMFHLGHHSGASSNG